MEEWLLVDTVQEVPSREDVRVYLLSCVFFIAAFFVARVLIRVCGCQFKEGAKADSWLLSAVTGSILTVSGAWAVFLCHEQGGFADVKAFGQLVTSGNRLSRAVAMFFLAHCHMDLALGVVFYRKHIDPLSGWVHHIVYTFVTLYCSLHCRVHFAFQLFGLDEIPTLMLAVGNIHQPWRQDWSFGITWFILRIAYHLYITYRLCLAIPHLPTSCLMAILSLMLHVHWWSNWVRSKLGKKKTKKAE